MTTATEILIPNDPDVFRSVFLYVGQGDATLHIAPDGAGGRKFVLVDINRDSERGGIDVVRMLEDVLPRDENDRPTLDLFINTHPHNDHVCGLDEVNKRIRVREVWHTGFKPSDKHSDSYRHLAQLVRDVAAREGADAAFEYQGSRRHELIGEVDVCIVSPATHVKNEVDQLEGEARDCRIHEYCGVIRLGYGPASRRRHVLHTGDSDRCAWETHILGEDDYHAERLPAAVLNASHHGSRSFFKNAEGDAPYERHVELIDATWVVISAPPRTESPHDHPHRDAIDLYRKWVRDGKTENVISLGDAKESRIYDVYPDGQHVMETDNGLLARDYALGGGGNGGPGGRSTIAAPAVITHVDRSRPMGHGIQPSN